MNENIPSVSTEQLQLMVLKLEALTNKALTQRMGI